MKRTGEVKPTEYQHCHLDFLEMSYGICGMKPYLWKMSVEGILGVHLAEGTVNAPKFKEFVKLLFIPFLNPFNWNNKHSLVIMDNSSIHHVENVCKLIEEQAGAKLIYLPPYSPDLNPVEGQVKIQVSSTFRILLNGFWNRRLLDVSSWLWIRYLLKWLKKFACIHIHKLYTCSQVVNCYNLNTCP